jgi:hypothetical protein
MMYTCAKRKILFHVSVRRAVNLNAEASFQLTIAPIGLSN